jgi:hypothetical protein
VTQPDLLSWREAEVRRDIGMERAVEHADRKEPDWSAQAMAALLDFVMVYADMPFLAEEVRAHADWIPPPPDGRAWGAVFQRAAREGHIVRLGYAPAKSSNLSPKVLWGRA